MPHAAFNTQRGRYKQNKMTKITNKTEKAIEETKFPRGTALQDGKYYVVSKTLVINTDTERLMKFDNISGRIWGDFGPADNVDKRVLPKKPTSEAEIQATARAVGVEPVKEGTEIDRLNQEEKTAERLAAAREEENDREDAEKVFTDLPATTKPLQKPKGESANAPAIDQKTYLKSMMNAFEPETVQLVKDLRRRIILSLEDDMYITYRSVSKKETMKQGHEVYNYSTTITKEGAMYIAQQAHIVEAIEKTVVNPIMDKKGERQIGFEVTGIIYDESKRYTVATGRCTNEDKGKAWMSAEQILAMARTRFFVTAIRKHFRLFNFHNFIINNDIPKSSISNF